MKKNKMMRLASSLLVAVLLTTSVISGTFAKYVTSDSAEDSARVAKWGVTVTAGGSLFGTQYIINADGGDKPSDSGTLRVVSSNNPQDNVVAPGTNNGDDTFKFVIAGTPEVDVKIDVTVESNTNDVFLKAGTYEKLTTGNPDDEYVLVADYYPVKYTLKHNGTAVKVNEDTELTLGELTTALTSLSKIVEANLNLEDAANFGEFEVSWAWDIDGDDDADTILGDLAAGNPNAGLNGATLTNGTDYNLNTGIKITVTVTQVD